MILRWKILPAGKTLMFILQVGHGFMYSHRWQHAGSKNCIIANGSTLQF